MYVNIIALARKNTVSLTRQNMTQMFLSPEKHQINHAGSPSYKKTAASGYFFIILFYNSNLPFVATSSSVI